MTKLHDMHDRVGQSPWIDNLRRAALRNGDLARSVADGIRGVTSNPTIFQKSVQEGTLYDEQLADLVADRSVEDAYWELAITDVADALSVLRPVYDESAATNGLHGPNATNGHAVADGFVSIEVAASLAHDTAGTISAARALHDRIARPNLLVKIPATAAGVPAIRQMTAEGRSVNVTLIFSLSRYEQVIEAYLRGLEEYLQAGPDRDLGTIHSVASFFVSRVDTEVDHRLEEVGTDEARALRGRAAVAQAKLAYRLFQESFSGPRWDALAAHGAAPQRPLWASTSTKNPAYPDLLYVESLEGPHTVNTMPEPTIQAFLDHGTVARRVDSDVDAAATMLSNVEAAGVSLADVAETLEAQGVALFRASYDDLIAALHAKADALRLAA